MGNFASNKQLRELHELSWGCLLAKNVGLMLAEALDMHNFDM